MLHRCRIRYLGSTAGSADADAAFLSRVVHATYILLLLLHYYPPTLPQMWDEDKKAGASIKVPTDARVGTKHGG